MFVYVVHHYITDTGEEIEFCQTNRYEDAVQICELAFAELVKKNMPAGAWTVTNRRLWGDGRTSDLDTIYACGA